MDQHILGKARLLAARRHRRPTTGSYLREHWRRHAIVAACFCMLVLVSCWIVSYCLAVAMGTLWVGRFSRDIQWYRALSREWDSTKELLDWEKIERIANSSNA